ncbi:MAG: hypothetical protein RSG55_06070, partial [Oscillospiraceae bacterium]
HRSTPLKRGAFPAPHGRDYLSPRRRGAMSFPAPRGRDVLLRAAAARCLAPRPMGAISPRVSAKHKRQ